MNNNRKRKHGTISAPSEDALNEFIKRHSDAAPPQQHLDEEEDQVDHVKVDYDMSDFRVINDSVHGHFELPNILFAFIDTPQFQRLREIKQLGSCYFVFPGACHNRFEHSLGVAYLSGSMCKTLQKRQPELNINTIDILCVQIAGLCHDLGHGPFSHFFDQLFIPSVHQDSNWRHEDASVQMFDHLINENNLSPLLKHVGLNETDIVFIKELISGPSVPNNNSDDWPYQGRPQSKSYLYEIVANKRTGIDVDKWDYFARDCYHLGISNNFDYKRFMKFARVISVDGQYQICTRNKEVSTLYDMFHTRNSLHRRAYQHKTSKIIDSMLCEVFIQANDHILLPGRNGPLKICECIHDMKAFTYLTDNIIKLIEVSTDENLRQSQAILQRIWKRDLYKMVGQTILKIKTQKPYCKQLCKDILNCGCDDVQLNDEDFVLHILTFDYGMKEKNPVDKVRFYDKSNPNKAVKVCKDQVSQMLPEIFAEQHLRFYCKKNDPVMIEQATRAFERWRENERQTYVLNSESCTSKS